MREDEARFSLIFFVTIDRKCGIISPIMGLGGFYVSISRNI